MSKRNIVVCVSWPYANNNLHLGYIASSLSGDILSRYHRMMGDNVLMVSGSDCHGTKIEIKAKLEGTTPTAIVDRYHANFVEALSAFDFSFDKFSKTYENFHKTESMKIFEKLYKNGYIYEKTNQRPYCEKCKKFVADTEIEIICPVCGRRTKADNCDCGYVPNEKDLEGATCLVCGEHTIQKENKVLVFKLTAFRELFEKMLEECKPFWRPNSYNETKKYVDDLRDRDFSRDLSWGVNIPIKGYEKKVVWVWYEALLGYVTDVMELGDERGFDWRAYFKTDVEPNVEKRIYMCHAKDNIVFHSMFFPAMLEGLHDNWVIPKHMVSSEYLLMNDQKISKSSTGQGNFEALAWSKQYDTDTLRFHFAMNGPEKRDSNFSIDLFKVTHNDIVNKFGNLVNRTLKYKGIEKLPHGRVLQEIKERVDETYRKMSDEIERIEFKKASTILMELVEFGNKFYDERKPWVQAKENYEDFCDTIFSCAYIIANLSNLAEPFMPKACAKIRKFLKIDSKPVWKAIDIKKGVDVSDTEPLFTRI